MSHLGERLSALIDGELSHQQRERVLAHLANCAACRREAAALRMLKQRMHALGEATADTALTDRLIAVAGVTGVTGMAGAAPWRRWMPLGRRSVPGVPRRRWPVRSLAWAGLTLAGLGVPAAAFLAGGGQQDLGPSVTPPIDTFVVQHEISTGSAPMGAPSRAGAPGSAAHHAPAPASTAPAAGYTSSAVLSGPAVFTAVGVTVALTRVAAAATNAAVAGSARGRKPHPAMTAAGAR